MSPSSLFSAISVFCCFSFGIRHEVKENEACPGWQTAFGWRVLTVPKQGPPPCHCRLPLHGVHNVGKAGRKRCSLIAQLSGTRPERSSPVDLFLSLLFLWYFTFPTRQDEKQIPPKYDERGYSWSVYSPASLENVWLPPKTANSHCVSKPVSELSGTYPIWTFWSLLISVYKGLLRGWVKEGQPRSGVWGGSRAGKFWWALHIPHRRAVAPCSLNAQLCSAQVSGQPDHI